MRSAAINQSGETERMEGSTPWLTIEGACARAQCGKRVIYRAVKAGKLKAARINERGDLRFLPEWIGTPTGERIASVKTAWRLTCARAGIEDLKFHDLRREAGSRLLESGRFFLHDVQRFLDHADITTTSRYLQASRMGLHSAMRQYEADQAAAAERARQTSDEAEAERPKAESDVAPDATVN
jgi:integrase